MIQTYFAQEKLARTEMNILDSHLPLYMKAKLNSRKLFEKRFLAENEGNMLDPTSVF
jgi:hypothetical protein